VDQKRPDPRLPTTQSRKIPHYSSAASFLYVTGSSNICHPHLNLKWGGDFFSTAGHINAFGKQGRESYRLGRYPSFSIKL
jgi:hypothetical protein